MKTILVTDDDPAIQDIFRIIFEKAGYSVDISSDAKCILENNFGHPHVIVLDRQLSGVDGLDVCRYLKSKSDTNAIPVVMISATPDIGRMSKEAGAEDYIEKPFIMKDLLATIAHWATVA